MFCIFYIVMLIYRDPYFLFFTFDKARYLHNLIIFTWTALLLLYI